MAGGRGPRVGFLLPPCRLSLSGPFMTLSFCFGSPAVLGREGASAKQDPTHFGQLQISLSGRECAALVSLVVFARAAERDEVAGV